MRLVKTWPYSCTTPLDGIWLILTSPATPIALKCLTLIFYINTNTPRATVSTFTDLLQRKTYMMWNLWHWDVSQMWNPSTEYLSDSYNSPLPISYCYHLFLIPTAQIRWGQTKWVCADTVWLLWQVTRRIFWREAHEAQVISVQKHAESALRCLVAVTSRSLYPVTDARSVILSWGQREEKTHHQ